MRKLVLAALLVVGCSNAKDLSNRGTVPGQGNYPAGPYGYAQDSIMANLSFLAKVDPGLSVGTANYADLTPQNVQLADYFNDPNVGFIVLTGAAGWCGPCREEAATIPATAQKWEPMGVRFLTVLIQGFDEAAQTPATMDDIDGWQVRTKEHIALGTDPKDNLHDFAAEVGSFPLNILVRTADMMILWQELGVSSTDPSIDPILQAYAN